MTVINNPMRKAVDELLRLESCLYMEFTIAHVRVHTPIFWECFDNWIV